ncbi:MAG: MmgE/PrpD family protein [Betaproteobacteria bacterium]|nr:MAG: MmgE/PrpD family protein [Betaproteobacteria bacterium]
MNDAAQSTGSSTRLLADFAATLRFEQIPPDVLARAKLSLLDTLGCCLLGSTCPPARKLHEFFRSEGGRPVASILGASERTSPTLAALVNGTAGHAFQLDEVHSGAVLHPGSVVLPAVMAAAESAGGLNGRDWLAAIVAGYEVGIRVGLAARGRMFERGFHNQGTTGAIAAAAASRALALDAGSTAQALGLAASLAAGLMAVQEGAMAKALHSGRAAQSGVLAAFLARTGYTGIDDVLDSSYGRFYDSFVGGAGAGDFAAALRERWEMLGVGYKLSPASNGSITAMQTLARIMTKHHLDAQDIERIIAHVSTNTQHHCGFAFDPKTASVLAAQMSVRYGLSVMALDKQASPAQFTPQRIGDKRLADFLPRVELRVSPDFDAPGGKLRLASRLEVQCKDGKVLVDETLYRKGSVEDPVSPAEIEEKFRNLAVPVIGKEKAEACAARIRVLENEPKVGSPLEAPL